MSRINGLNIAFSPLILLFGLASAFPENRAPLFGPMPPGA